MNIETGQIKPQSELTDEEKASGKWIPLPKRYLRKYAQKQAVSEIDRARIVKAEAKRARKAESRQ